MKVRNLPEWYLIIVDTGIRTSTLEKNPKINKRRRRLLGTSEYAKFLRLARFIKKTQFLPLKTFILENNETLLYGIAKLKNNL